MTWSVPARGRRTSGFGPRVAPVPGASTFHRGVDIAPPVRGQRDPVSVHAVGAGTVVGTGTNAVRGLWVAVRHDDGATSTYQHLASRVVSVGQLVRTGDWLGVMGATGTDSGVHLHLECFGVGVAWTQSGSSWRSAAAQDPEAFLAARGIDVRGGLAAPDPIAASPGAPPRPTAAHPAGAADPLVQEEDDMAVIDDSERMLQLAYQSECGRPASDPDLYPRLRRIAAAPDWRAQLSVEIGTIDSSTESNRADVHALYRALLGRDGSVAEWDGHAVAIGHPVDNHVAFTADEIAAITARIRASEEFQARLAAGLVH